MVRHRRMDVLLLLKLLLITGFVFHTTIAALNFISESDISYNLTPLGYIKPLVYSVELHLNISTLTFSGHSIAAFENKQPTNEIFIFADKLDIKEEDIILNSCDKAQRNYTYDFKSRNYVADAQILVITFNSALPPGCYMLNTIFTGILNNGESGFVTLDVEQTTKAKREIFATKSFYPLGARKLFPCWDYPGMKTIFSIAIEHDQLYDVLFNMPKISKKSEHVSTWTYFEFTPYIPANLLAIVIYRQDFIIKIPDVDNYYVGMWCRLNFIPYCQFARSIAERVAQQTSQYLRRVIREIPEIKIIVPPIEHQITRGWGLVVISESYISYNDNENSDDRKLEVVFTVARQMIYQCFGYFTTPSKLSDAWLNEALVTYLQYKFLDQEHQQWRVMDCFVIHFQQQAFDSEFEIWNIMHMDKDFNKINRLFNVPSHRKAPFLLRMMEHFLTEKNFRTGLIQYYDKSKIIDFESSPKQFWQTMQDAVINWKNEFFNCKEFRLEDVMENWLTKDNYPLLYIRRNYKKNVFLISQKPSLIEKEENDTNWWIPISFATQSKPDFNDTMPKYWMKPNIPLELYNYDGTVNDWIIVNLQQTGFYRVNYDNVNWLKIINYLITNDSFKNIHVINRAQIIDDAYYFLNKNELSPHIFNQLIFYLKKESDYLAWQPMQRILPEMWHFYQFPEGKVMKIRVLSMLEKLLQHVGYTETPGESNLEKESRLFVLNWTCKFNHHVCKQKATQKLKEYTTSRKTVPALWEKWTYCIGLEKASPIIWQLIYEEFTNTRNEMLLKCLAYSRDESIIIYYLETLQTDSSLKDKSYMIAYKTIVKNHAKRHRVLHHLILNFTLLKPRKLNTLKTLQLIVDNIYSLRQLDKVKKFVLFNYNINIEKSELEKLIDHRQRYINTTLKKYTHRFHVISTKK